MEDYLKQARDELKRLEHIIYVSLKYTRTVDVIINAINRMVNMFDIIIYAILEKEVEEGRLASVPKSPALCAKKVRDLHQDDEVMQNNLDFYTFMRTLLKEPYEKRQEFRRHVTMITQMDKGTAEMSIDSLENCEKYVHKFYEYAYEKIMGKPLHDEDEF